MLIVAGVYLCLCKRQYLIDCIQFLKEFVKLFLCFFSSSNQTIIPTGLTHVYSLFLFFYFIFLFLVVSGNYNKTWVGETQTQERKIK